MERLLFVERCPRLPPVRVTPGPLLPGLLFVRIAVCVFFLVAEGCLELPSATVSTLLLLYCTDVDTYLQ